MRWASTKVLVAPMVSLEPPAQYTPCAYVPQLCTANGSLPLGLLTPGKSVDKIEANRTDQG